MGKNGLTKNHAVALIGAHTVGHHHSFNAWVEDPMAFDNKYFVNLQQVMSVTGGGRNDFSWDFNGNQRYSTEFPDWFQDSFQLTGTDSFFCKGFSCKIHMLDADMSIVQNAPELVTRYAN